MKATLNVSLTETAQFRRLIKFVHDVEAHARYTWDRDLEGMVVDLRQDLARAST